MGSWFYHGNGLVSQLQSSLSLEWRATEEKGDKLGDYIEV